MAFTVGSPLSPLIQSGSLILLSIFFFPLITYVAILGYFISPLLQIPRHITHFRRWRQTSSSTFRPRNILVTGVGMSKGLALSRIFYRAGHMVYGADFEPNSIPVPGRFSTSVKKFHRLGKPTTDSTSAEYIQSLIRIIKAEKIELWASVSGEASALEDGEAAEIIEKETDCKVIQFGLTLTETLHDKYSFIQNTRHLGLNVPDTNLVTSETEALTVLYPEKPRSANRANMTLLPRPTVRETEVHIKRLNPTPFRPYVLQEFITGPEYCAHALVIAGKVRAFVASPSAEMLLHYTALPTSSALSQAMLLYLSTYASKTRLQKKSMTGHFSIDFLVEESVAREAEARIGVAEEEVFELMGNISAIECNPRANTAILLFSDVAEDLSEIYLSVLDEHEPKGVANGHRDPYSLITPPPDTTGYYWIGHDFAILVILPIFQILKSLYSRKGFENSSTGILKLGEQWLEFLKHVLYWREGVFEVWDPWPAWWMYCIYWPLRFAICVWEGRRWKKVNVATGKMFGYERRGGISA